ncbi:MAG: hypothetical protein IJP49_08945 [Bacteroidales bacterium]|nr:hypothetical protein [Bacteroidales bacterium]
MKNVLLLFLLLSVSVSCANYTTTIVDGSLPEGYEWAYGEWRADYEGVKTSLFIGGDYIQNDLPFIQMAEGAALPRIVCYPKLEYYVETISDDEINLVYEGSFGYESILTLNKKSKRVEGGYKKCREKYNAEAAIVEYGDRTKQSPFWGRWTDEDDDKYSFTLSPEKEPFIISNDGKKLISLYNGAYKLESDDRISTEYFEDSGSGIATYVRTILMLTDSDVFHYLVEHTFYNAERGISLSFSNNLELIQNGRVVSERMNAVGIHGTYAIVAAYSTQRLASVYRMRVEPTKKQIMDVGSRLVFKEQ